jgi:hypothetical protein
MWPRYSARIALPVLLVASLALCGCAKTGLAWVNEPPSGGFDKRDARAAANTQRELPPAAEPSDENAPPVGITKTISLGQSVTANDQPPPDTAQQALVIRTNPYYRPYSYGFVTAAELLEPIEVEEPVVVDPDVVVVPQNPPQGVQPGQDFPPPPNFGPPFPFRSAPADPFAPATPP